MTNTEIIEGLKALRTIHNGNYALHVDEAIKRLSVEPYEDAISRRAVTEVLIKNRVHFCDMIKITSELKELSPVTPKPKNGRWISDKYGQYCDQCGNGINTPYKFCPFCGADMREYTSEIPSDSEKE